MPSNLAQWQVSEYASRGDSTQLQDMLVNRLINKLTNNNNNTSKQSIDTNTFVASVLMPFDIVKIYSPTHELKTKRTSCQAVVDASISSSSSSSTSLQQSSSQQSSSQDLILIVEIATIHMPRMLVEDFYDPDENRTTRACMVSFYPEFELDSVGHREKPSTIHLLVDLSNSMKENNLIKWSRTLALCMLNHLPAECLFNVTLFGSHFEQAFPCEVKNTPANMHKAKELLRRANRAKGNTDVLGVLREHLSLASSWSLKQSRPQNFLLISDGHFTQPNELFATLRRSNNLMRVFACSLGSNANSFYMKTISRLTNASCEEFSTSLKSKWTRKCIDLVDKCKQPAAVSDIHIEWQNMRPGVSVQAPQKIGNTFFLYI